MKSWKMILSIYFNFLINGTFRSFIQLSDIVSHRKGYWYVTIHFFFISKQHHNVASCKFIASLGLKEQNDSSSQFTSKYKIKLHGIQILTLFLHTSVVFSSYIFYVLSRAYSYTHQLLSPVISYKWYISFLFYQAPQSIFCSVFAQVIWLIWTSFIVYMHIPKVWAQVLTTYEMLKCGLNEQNM